MLKNNCKPLLLLSVLILVLAVGLTACGAKTAESKDLQEEMQATAIQEMLKEDQESMAAQVDDPAGMDVDKGTVDVSETSSDDDMKHNDDEGVKKSEEEMIEEPSVMMAPPDFFSAVLTDPATGQTFTINDYKGEVILVETLAMWCSNCFKQQNEVKSLHGMLGEENNFISLGLDIDPNENINDLRGYVEKNDFDWTYAVAPVEVAREIGQLYGEQFLNPSATPMFIIDQHGKVYPLPFGIKSAEQLIEALEPFLNETM